MSYKDYITEVPNFPEEGVNFKDISPLLANEEVFGDAIVEMRNLTHKVPDYWIGIDSRGFIFASVNAIQMWFSWGRELVRWIIL